jgi:hypothetical protein
MFFFRHCFDNACELGERRIGDDVIELQIDLQILKKLPTISHCDWRGDEAL